MLRSSILAVLYALLGIAVIAQLDQPPNIILILTDDQDQLLDSTLYMNGLKTNLQAQGTTYTRHYCTVSLCCPSRATLLTGKAAHNTNITDVVPPFGGYQVWASRGYNDNWLGIWLQNAGYQTYYTGKFLNGINVSNYKSPFVNGLDGHDFLVGPGMYNYYYPVYQRNDEEPVYYSNQYTTDLLTNKSLAFIDQAMLSQSPFFLGIAPIAPHSQASDEVDAPSVTDPLPQSAEQYQDLFPDAIAPRRANFNPNVTSGASWVRQQTQITDAYVEYYDQWYRQRLRALQSVDELINKTIAALDFYNITENTYIIFTSDNGYHIGNHRLAPGKRCPYEEDINVPLIIRGPGIPAGETAQFVTSHIDMVPTILAMARASSHAPTNLDGQAIPSSDIEAQGQNWEHLQAEHWGGANNAAPNLPYKITKNNTYKALRAIGDGYNLFYSVWCNNEHELYDMNEDPYQMQNLYDQPNQTILGVPISTLQTRLDSLLLVLKTCSGLTCTDPWSALHPEGGVSNLQQALSSRYDGFYLRQNKVKYNACSRGYFSRLEKPLNFKKYHIKGS